MRHSTSAGALPDPRSGPGKDAALVQRMFDRVAPRYDLANTLFSLGRDRRWRRAAVNAVRPRPGEIALDVAAGTGMLAHELRLAGACVIALDFSLPMLAHGAAREAAGRMPGQRRMAGGGPRVLWCNADGLALPLAEASVDVVTIGFGLRNLPDPAAGLAEFARVVRPGGRLAVLEFSTPTSPAFRRLYHGYLLGAIPRVARLATSEFTCATACDHSGSQRIACHIGEDTCPAQTICANSQLLANVQVCIDPATIEQ